jgi:hypothetical protein
MIAALYIGDGVLQGEQVPVYTGAIMVAVGVGTLVLTTVLRASAINAVLVETVMQLAKSMDYDLAGEKKAQIEGASLVLRPLTFAVAVVVFALCFWRYDIGLLLSIGAAILTFPAFGLGISFPVGYVLGKRAARRFSQATQVYPQKSPGTPALKWITKHGIGFTSALSSIWGIGICYEAIVASDWLKFGVGAALCCVSILLFQIWWRLMDD